MLVFLFLPIFIKNLERQFAGKALELSIAKITLRCAQPLSGFSARCVEDENLMDHIRRAGQNLGTCFIIDTRPKVNAYANKMQGKGFEDIRYYNNMQLHTFDIENIHVMRNSQTKLLEGTFGSK